MYSEKVIIEIEIGLHARPALHFVKIASRFKSNVTIKKDGEVANGKSIINILSLGVKMGEEISICSDGEDEELAVRELIKLVKTKFGE